MTRMCALILALTMAAACTSGPATPFIPTAIAGPSVQLATTPSELRASYEPLFVCSGGATQVHAFAMGLASDGVLRGVPDLPVQWGTSYGSLLDLGTMSARTDGGGHSAVLLNVPGTPTDTDIVVTAGSLSSSVTLRAYGQPCSVAQPPPAPPGATGTVIPRP